MKARRLIAEGMRKTGIRGEARRASLRPELPGPFSEEPVNVNSVTMHVFKTLERNQLLDMTMRYTSSVSFYKTKSD